MKKAVEGLYMEKYVLKFHALNQDVVALLLLEDENKSRSFALSIEDYQNQRRSNHEIHQQQAQQQRRAASTIKKPPTATRESKQKSQRNKDLLTSPHKTQWLL
ncbi:hypothetical protein CMV_025914 [Castanea mollissima]|uniref:Uncharacterized protein n=1 Tax=Castanea mollissima TaxID=60419 RepID=A0A8J4QCJ0_9ROSI|nr:hypothetical protein CMV_025914 [Castanea mollissima]